MKTKTRQTILKGQGANQHTLYGEFLIDEQPTAYAELSVKKDSVLKHEQPNGSFAEHKGLQVEKGNWVMGRQVEYNPFDQRISQVWD